MAQRDLHNKIGSFEPEKLFAGNEPAALVRGGTIAKGAAETTYKRGTLMEKDSSGKLHIRGTANANSPDCVLTDDVTVGTAADENVTVYISGYFNEEALIVAEDYTITETDRDVLRTKGILLGGVQAI